MGLLDGAAWEKEFGTGDVPRDIKDDTENEFVPTKIAVVMRDLGFDKKCLGFYGDEKSTKVYFNSLRDATGDYKPFKNNERLSWVPAPLYQQAFRWFLEKYGLFAEICLWGDDIGYTSVIKSHTKPDVFTATETFNNKNYREAEDACLEKLIELIRNR